MNTKEKLFLNLDFHKKNVFLFNDILHRRGTLFTTQAIQLQIGLTREEMNEYSEACELIYEIKRGFIKKDLEPTIQLKLDAICDVFVTAIWLQYIITYSEAYCPCIPNGTDLAFLLEHRPYCIKELDVYEWIYNELEKDSYCKHNFNRYMDAVLKSNMSKFLLRRETESEHAFDVRLKTALQDAKKRYKGSFGNEALVQSTFDEHHYMIRGEGGVGKLLKHQYYQSPTDILESHKAKKYEIE